MVPQTPVCDAHPADAAATDAQRKSEVKPFSLDELAEVATKAMYTHGFGFRGVVGPTEPRDGKVYVELYWLDGSMARAAFWLETVSALEPDETAWLIEETWSGHVHYVHRDFNCADWAAECRRDNARRSYGLPPLARPIVTKDVAEAMRFPTRDAAELWKALQPKWLAEGEQYQLREHMWPALSSEAPSPKSEPEASASAPATDDHPTSAATGQVEEPLASSSGGTKDQTR